MTRLKQEYDLSLIYRLLVHNYKEMLISTNLIHVL